MNKITDIDLKNNLYQILNPYDYVNTNVTGYDISVSKYIYDSHFWFEVIEIIGFFDIHNYLHKTNINTNINTRIISSEMNIEPFNLIYNRTTYDNVIGLNNNVQTLLEEFIYKPNNDLKIDFFIFSFKDEDYLDMNKYMINMLLTLQIIMTQQSIGGVSIIKIDNILNKILIDIIYILSSIYDKVNIIKPVVSNIMSNTRYLVCSNLNKNLSHLNETFKNIVQPVTESQDIGQVFSIIKNTVPIYFINKIEDINVNITHQQLDAYDNIINLSKSELNESKLEMIKRQNILKCIQWCEKYKIPHNKFIDRVNIFLHP